MNNTSLTIHLSSLKILAFLAFHKLQVIVFQITHSLFLPVEPFSELNVFKKMINWVKSYHGCPVKLGMNLLPCQTDTKKEQWNNKWNMSSSLTEQNVHQFSSEFGIIDFLISWILVDNLSSKNLHVKILIFEDFLTSHITSRALLGWHPGMDLHVPAWNFYSKTA